MWSQETSFFVYQLDRFDLNTRYIYGESKIIQDPKHKAGADLYFCFFVFL